MFEQVVRQARQKKICFIEDETVLTECVKEKLQSLSEYLVDHFIDTQSALRALNDNSYDLLILNLSDVADADRMIFAVRQTPDITKSVIPLIVISEKTDEMHYELLSVGADKVLIKPLTEKALACAITRLIPKSLQIDVSENVRSHENVISINSSAEFVDRRKTRRVLTPAERSTFIEGKTSKKSQDVVEKSTEDRADENPKNKAENSPEKSIDKDIFSADNPATEETAIEESIIEESIPLQTMALSTNEQIDTATLDVKTIENSGAVSSDSPPLSLMDAIQQQLGSNAAPEKPQQNVPPLSVEPIPVASVVVDRVIDSAPVEEIKPIVPAVIDDAPVIEDTLGVLEPVPEEILPIMGSIKEKEKEKEKETREPHKPEAIVSAIEPHESLFSESADDDIVVHSRFHSRDEKKKKTTTFPLTHSGSYFSSPSFKLFLFLALIVSVGNYWYFLESSLLNVSVEKVEKSLISSQISASGRVMSKRSVGISARADGQVSEILVLEGDIVKKGQVLIRFDAKDALSNLTRAEARVKSRLAEVNAAKKTYERLKTAFEFGAVTRRIVEDAEGVLTTTRAKHREVEEALVSANVKFDYLQVKAPFHGLVGHILVQEGQWLSTSETTLLFSDMNQRVIDIFVDKKLTNRLYIGQKVLVSSQESSGRAWNEKIMSIGGGALSHDGMMHEVKVQVSFDGSLRVGNQVDVDIKVDSRDDALLVPYYVLFSHNGSPHVASIVNGRITYIPVIIGLESDKRVEIVKGLREGQEIVVPLGQALEPGMRAEAIRK